jgi:DNA-binding NtrC family response regulator
VLAKMTANGVDVPVIIIIGQDSSEVYERAMAAGATTYSAQAFQ